MVKIGDNEALKKSHAFSIYLKWTNIFLHFEDFFFAILILPGACIIKRITEVICGLRNKLECLPIKN
jgi:hypothetical protein